VINLWHQKFVTLTGIVIAVFVNNQQGIQQRGQDFDKKVVFQEVHCKELDNLIDELIPKKSWTKLGVNKLLKKLQDTGTVGRQQQNVQCPH